MPFYIAVMDEGYGNYRLSFARVAPVSGAALDPK
jgi:hypothetical protein